MNENEDAFLAWKGDYILIQFALSLLLVSHHISSSGGERKNGYKREKRGRVLRRL